MTEHRPGINPGFLTKHTLSLIEADDPACKAMVEEIDALPWVDEVKFVKRKQRLKIAYDASRHNIAEMVSIVEKHGVAVSDSWWSRIKLGWARQTDGNIQGNANHVAHCCNEAPPGTANKH